MTRPRVLFIILRELALAVNYPLGCIVLDIILANFVHIRARTLTHLNFVVSFLLNRILDAIIAELLFIDV